MRLRRKNEIRFAVTFAEEKLLAAPDYGKLFAFKAYGTGSRTINPDDDDGKLF